MKSSRARPKNIGLEIFIIDGSIVPIESVSLKVVCSVVWYIQWPQIKFEQKNCALFEKTNIYSNVSFDI